MITDKELLKIGETNFANRISIEIASKGLKEKNKEAKEVCLYLLEIIETSISSFDNTKVITKKKKPLDKTNSLSKKQQAEADKFLAEIAKREMLGEKIAKKEKEFLDEIDDFGKGFEKLGKKEKSKKGIIVKNELNKSKPVAKSRDLSKITIGKKSVKIQDVTNG